MDFIERGYEFLKDPDIEQRRHRDYEAMRQTVIFLLQNALGRENSKSEEVILNHLRRRGIKMSVKHWHQNVLGHLREHVLFVGTWSGGSFIIVDRDDARAAEDFLTARIEDLEHRLAILRGQVEDARLL